MDSFYNLQATSLKKQPVDFADYRDKVVVLVNTASKCGFTHQFEGLQALYDKYHDQGLVILGFPCNQFANQEPGDEASIKAGCILNYGVTFPMFSKIDVNGRNAHPVYRWLTSALPGKLGSKKIKWNFTKFLVDKEGKPVKRFAPAVEPEKLEDDILALL